MAGQIQSQMAAYYMHDHLYHTVGLIAKLVAYVFLQYTYPGIMQLNCLLIYKLAFCIHTKLNV